MTQLESVVREDQKLPWFKGFGLEHMKQSELGYAGQALHKPRPELLRTIAGYLRACWKFLERTQIQRLSSRRLRLAETISLGEKRSISILHVDGAQYLIGHCAGSVQLLTTLNSQARIDTSENPEISAKASQFVGDEWAV